MAASPAVSSHWGEFVFRGESGVLVHLKREFLEEGSFQKQSSKREAYRMCCSIGYKKCIVSIYLDKVMGIEGETCSKILDGFHEA